MAKQARRHTTSRTARTAQLPDEWRRRLQDVEKLARANRRELEIQFQRMADLQAEVDALKKRMVAAAVNR